MLTSPDSRIALLAGQKPIAAPPELEAVFVGGAPVAIQPDAAVEARAAAAQLGFGQEDDPALIGRPLAFTTLGGFTAAFPQDEGWLYCAIRDYFSGGGRRAWVVRIEVEADHPTDSYFLSSPAGGGAQLPVGGVEIAMQVPSAGLLILPDLEYLCLAASLPAHIAIPLPQPPAPAFRPMRDFVPPSIPVIAPEPPNAAPVSPNNILTSVMAALSSRRPDMLCLFALPMGADQTLSAPALVQRAGAYLYGPDGSGPDLRQVQAFAPLLRDAAGNIASPTGLIAGVLAATAETAGVWRSIAGRALPLGMTPLRRLESNALNSLRSQGVAALRFGTGATVLDDDILACRDTPENAERRPAGTRRLMGWLLRNLQSYGEQLVFENVLDDGRVELVLLDLFTTLLKRGALNGTQIADAVRITRRKPVDSAIEFDIGIDAAVALETIRLQFLDGALTTALGAAA